MADDPQDFVQRGMLALDSGDFSEAMRICRVGLIKSPNRVDGRLVLSHALVAQSRFDEALAELRLILNVNPLDTGALLLRGEALIGKYDFDQADATLHIVQRRLPNDPKLAALFERSRAARIRGTEFLDEPSQTRVYPATLQRNTPAPASGDDGEPPPMQPMNIGGEVAPLGVDPGVLQSLSGRYDLTDDLPMLDSSVLESEESQPTLPRGHVVRSTRQEPDDEISETRVQTDSIVGELAQAAPRTGAFSDTDATTTPEAVLDDPTMANPRPSVKSASDVVLELPPPTQVANAAKRNASRPNLPPPPPARVTIDTEKSAPISKVLDTPGILAEPTRYKPGRRRARLREAILPVLGVIIVAAVSAVVLVKWRARVQRDRLDRAVMEDLATGNHSSYIAADLLLRQNLQTQDLPHVHLLQAQVLGRLAAEFGESRPQAHDAITALGESTDPEVVIARTYLALADGRGELARQLALQLKDARPAQSAYLLGRALLLSEQNSAAVESLRAAVRLDPRRVMFWHQLGVAEVATHQPRVAIEAFKMALTINANHIWSILDRALAELHDGVMPSNAEASLRGIVDKLNADCSPGQLARAYLGLAEIELLRGRSDEGRKMIDLAIGQRRPDDLVLSEDLARVFALAYDLEHAEREAKRVLAVTTRTRPKLVLADVALRRGQPEIALELASSLDPNDVEVELVRVRANLMRGAIDDAERDAAAAQKQLPNSVDTQLASARVEIARGHAKATIATLERLEQHVHLAETATVLAQANLAINDPKRARTWLKEALLRQPLDLEAHIALADLDEKDKHPAEAITELQELLKSQANYLPARRRLARLEFESGDTIAARDEYAALLERQDDAVLARQAAMAYLYVGDGARAYELLTHNGVAPEPLLLARAAIEAGRFDDALNAVASLPNTADAATWRVRAYAGKRDFVKAIATLKKVRTKATAQLSLATAWLFVAQKKPDLALRIAATVTTEVKRARGDLALQAELSAVRGLALLQKGGAFAKFAAEPLKAALDLDPHLTQVKEALDRLNQPKK